MYSRDRVPEPDALSAVIARLSAGLRRGSRRLLRVIGWMGIGLFTGWLGAASADAARWRLLKVPRTARGALLAVSCTSRASCIAVGSSGGRRTSILAERWNGRRWSVVPAPSPRGARNAGLDAVSCLSSSQCVAAGAYDNGGNRAWSLAMRWNGQRWSIQPTPDQPGQRASVFDGISCVSPTSCVAVGGDGNPDDGLPFPLIERWNGTRWTIQRAARPGRNGFLSGVSCASSRACTAVGDDGLGDPQVQRWNGRAWSVQAPYAIEEDSTALFSVSCTSMTVCHAVGGDANSAETTSLAEHWDGRRWTGEYTPDLGGDELDAISCTSARTCTAVGSRQGGSEMLAETWNGVRWSIQATPDGRGAGTFSRLSAVSCTSPLFCVAVGEVDDERGTLRPVAVQRS